MATTAKVLKFSAAQGRSIGSDDQGEAYTFTGFELPTGEVLVPSEGYPDAIWESRDAVEPFGDDEIVGVEETGRTVEFSAEDLRATIKSAINAFGLDSVPESVARYLVD